jgi:hypothetical protein
MIRSIAFLPHTPRCWHFTVAPRRVSGPPPRAPPIPLLRRHEALALALLTASPHPHQPSLSRRALTASLLAAVGMLCLGAAVSLLPEDARWAAVAGNEHGLRQTIVNRRG